jgi:hypothetical protein
MRQSYELDNRTRKLLAGANFVLDYSLWNRAELKKQVALKEVFVVPILPIPRLSKTYDDALSFESRTTKILFYGGDQSPRRKLAIQRFRHHYPEIRIITNASYSQLEREIANARVVVNVHYYDWGTLETLRISEVLSELTPVVSEFSPNSSETPLSDVIDFVGYEDFDGLVIRALEIASDYKVFQDRQIKIMTYLESLHS